MPRLLLPFLATMLLAPACAGPRPAHALHSPLADRDLAPRGAPPFTFVACGHVYGEPGEGHARPAATFAGHVGRLRATGADFLMLLGDCVYTWRDDDLARLATLAGRELALPVFNAPGNHDLADRADYERRFGPAWFAFDHGGCRMLVLDTEADPWHIGGAQLAWLQRELAAARSKPPRAVFVFGHKPVWAVSKRLAVAALGGNDPRSLAVVLARPADAPTFRRDLLPAVRELAAVAPVWWFAGDVGAFETSLHLFHAQDDVAPDLHFVAAGLGDRARDAFVRIDVPAAGTPRGTAVEFVTGRELDLADYGPEAWRARLFPHGLPAEVQAVVDGW